MFYDLLDLALRDKKISYTKLSESLGVTKQNISIVKKRGNPREKTMIKFCKGAGVELTISIRNPDTRRVFSETYDYSKIKEKNEIELTNEFMTE